MSPVTSRRCIRQAGNEWVPRSDHGEGDGPGRADLDAALATKAVLGTQRHDAIIVRGEHVHRADTRTGAAPVAEFRVDADEVDVVFDRSGSPHSPLFRSENTDQSYSQSRTAVYPLNKGSASSLLTRWSAIGDEENPAAKHAAPWGTR